MSLRPEPNHTIRLLHRVSTELNRARDPKRVLEITMDSLDAVFGFQHCSVFLLNEKEDLLDLAVARGERSCRIRAQIRLGSGIVGTAAAKREVVRLNRTATPLIREPTGDIAGHLAVPMLAKDSLVGVVYLETVSERLLRKDDELLVTIVANQSAVALENAQLYESLESRVEARTAELAAANRQLRETQAELVQSGKMVALGQLAAGLAHETNTPLGAIRSNVQVTERAVARLREHPELGPVLADTPNLARLLTILHDASQTTRDASARLFAIFETLRTFAKLDQSALQWADLHQGLDSAVSLLRHRVDDQVQVVRDYGEVPRVLCYASELNQVFLIALTNAIEALNGGGTITLRTRASDNLVKIEIVDTGRGMTEEHLERAFDPGFTTKGVRVGTGLSLAIAYRIVQKHGGRIGLVSAVHEGTIVNITLPISGVVR